MGTLRLEHFPGFYEGLVSVEVPLWSADCCLRFRVTPHHLNTGPGDGVGVRVPVIGQLACSVSFLIMIMCHYNSENMCEKENKFNIYSS